MANVNLTSAKKAKNDEFYTQFHDIEKEMNAYLELNPNIFRDKTILLPCDDPEWSNFTKYFAQNFANLGLKKLISTSFASDSKNGKIFTLTREDVNADGKVDINDIKFDYLKNDGDFRSAEVTKIRDEADIIITNPPFSLFREFLNWIVSAKQKKSFLIIGNMNAITYKEVFPLIAKNEMWLGVSSGAKEYITPNGEKQKMGNTSWFTNIDHGRRHQPLQLMTMADNIKFAGASYPKYDNYDAIEVARTAWIPKDYDGVMGVPISFLDKYNPDQFEIVAFRKGDDGKDLVYSFARSTEDVKKKPSHTSEFWSEKDWLTRCGGNGFWYGKHTTKVYKRILIRHIRREIRKADIRISRFKA